MRRLITLIIVFMICSLISFGQNRVVTGKITDEKGASVEGATVKVKGTKKGVAADANGNYSISVPKGAVLVISGVNISPKEITITSESTLDVSVVRNANELSNVVITALGIAREPKSLGYAISSVNNKTLTQGKSVNLQQALNGKVSGLNISTVNSGVFESAKINIRGIRSLTGKNQPMLVVDGAPTPLGYLSSIPPDDVQDLTVLKSAASAAIYGPDAVNGVIIVSTRKGSKTPTVILTSSVQATRISFFPKLQKEFGAAGGETTDQYGNLTYVPYENQQFGPRFDGTIRPVGKPIEDGSIQMLPYNNSHYRDKINFWNTGLTLQNSASLIGEDFYLSVEDAKIKGLIPDDINHRTSFRFNGAKKYGKFSTSYSLNYILSNSDIVNESAFDATFPGGYNGGMFNTILQTPSNVPLLSYKDLNSKWGQYSNYYNEFAVNPYWLIANIRSKSRQDNLLGNVEANYQIFPWLKASARVSADLSFQNTTNTNAPVVVSDFAAANRGAFTYSNKNGIVSNDQNYSSRLNLDYYLSGDKKFLTDFNVKYIAGSAVRQNRSKDVAVGGNNLVVPYLYNVAVRSGDANVPLYRTNPTSTSPSGNFYIESTLISAYGSVGFGYKGWANLEFTGRNDWDSRLLKQNRSFFYPAANASLVLSDAINAIKNSNTISYLKLRAAISKSGNVNLNPYSLSSTYYQPAGFPYGNNVGFTANKIIPNADLKPEFVNTKELGFELGLFKNRLNFEATAFNQNNTDQILQISQSVTTGYTTGLANAADFKNYGVEMDLGLTPLFKLGKGRFDVKINATYNNNKVTHTLGNASIVIGGSANFIAAFQGSPTINNIANVGFPAFQFQMSDYLRDSATGKVVVDRVTGFPIQNPSLVTKGRSLPLWVVGFTPSFTIGDFSISMTWDYKGGHNFYSGLGPDLDNSGLSERSAQYGRQKFVFPNSVYYDGTKYVPNTNIQVADGNYGFWTQAYNTAAATNYFASAAAIRLRELNISYSLPKRWYGKTFKRITLSAVGKNLLLFVPKSNQWGDPEFNYSATGNTFGLGSSYQSPASRLFGGSLTVQF